MKIELAPSILSSNFAQLGSDALQAIEGGGTILHVDVMDGHFVPNITLGPPVVKSLRKAVKVPLDCHLMIENPDLFIPEFAAAGADWISVHQEATVHLDRTPNALNKIAALARLRAERKLDFRIEVDGGVDLETVADVVKAGAELLVAGNAVFGHGDIRGNAAKLLEAARAAVLTRA